MNIEQFNTLDKYVIDKLKTDDEYLNLYIKETIKNLRKERDIPLFLAALKRIVEAKGGITRLAKRTGITQQAIYTTLSENGNPKLKNFEKILEAIGFQIDIRPINKKLKYI